MSLLSRVSLATLAFVAILVCRPGGLEGKGKKKARGWWATLPVAGASGSGAPEIILTFDDGPHEKYTAQILDELKRRNIKAVFFWVGRRVRGKDTPGVSKRLALVQRALREGHIIANHTMSHPYLCKLSRKEAGAEIDENARIFAKLTGSSPRLIRIPFGNYCRKVVGLLEQRGLRHIHWDIDPMEWKDHDAERTYVTLRRKFRHLEGRAVVLMHDTKKATVTALPRALDWIEKENARRKKRKNGKRPIRILSGKVLLHQAARPEFASWLHDTGSRVASRANRVLGRLLP